MIVYIGNQSIGKDVWFDNLNIENYESEVLEEDHYYPFGLTLNTTPLQNGANPNPYKLTTKELESNFNLNIYDFGARTYDMTGPIWGQIDPLAEKYYSISPYAYCANNPVMYKDPDGQEPIKLQAGTVSGFIAFLNNTSTKMGTLTGRNAQDALHRLAKVDWSQGKPTPATTAPFNLQKDRYIYTEKGGWIDMAHFMFYAGKGYEYKEAKDKAQAILNNKDWNAYHNDPTLIKTANQDPVREAVQDCYMQERTDQIFAKWSSYSYEDLPTDKFAADFGANYFDPKSKLTLGGQIQNYLNNNLEATTPDKAPNYSTLPTKEPTDNPSRTNTTTTPIFINENLD